MFLLEVIESNKKEVSLIKPVGSEANISELIRHSEPSKHSYSYPITRKKGNLSCREASFQLCKAKAHKAINLLQLGPKEKCLQRRLAPLDTSQRSAAIINRNNEM